MCWNGLLKIFINFHFISCQTVYSLSNKGNFKYFQVFRFAQLDIQLCVFVETSLQLLAGLFVGEKETTYMRKKQIRQIDNKINNQIKPINKQIKPFCNCRQDCLLEKREKKQHMRNKQMGSRHVWPPK